MDHCRAAGYDVVVLVGHPDYYPRFGFVPAHTYGIELEYDVPREAFMLIELNGGTLTGTRGIIRFHPAFNDAM